MTAACLASRASADPSQALREAFIACRDATLARIADLDDRALSAQSDPGFSPIGWHVGHIAYTEALWLAPGADFHPEWERLFRQDGLPKFERRRLPSRAALEEYLATVRGRILAHLDAGLLGASARLWHFILQHEAQHGETITIVRRLAGFDGRPSACQAPGEDDDGMIEVPGGSIRQGHDGPEALDNERPSHHVAVDAFRLSKTPVSQGRFRRFIEADGYREQAFWSAEGWAWRRAHDITAPRYWVEGSDVIPVHGISAYEAEAYCRSIGVRLPTEAEWEHAAVFDPTLGALGQVWQWTSTPFAPYPGFKPFPYPGYSAAYFDGRHRVLKGGSWATAAPVLRPSFRNWYEPGTRQIFAGFRYAQDI